MKKMLMFALAGSAAIALLMLATGAWKPRGDAQAQEAAPSTLTQLDEMEGSFKMNVVGSHHDSFTVLFVYKERIPGLQMVVFKRTLVGREEGPGLRFQGLASQGQDFKIGERVEVRVATYEGSSVGPHHRVFVVHKRK